MRFYDKLLGNNELSNLGLNKRQHRSKDIEDINLKNYILFAGDNVALDFNSPIENTYPYLVSQSLNVDYYNLAIFNGGIDATKYNLLTWFNTVPAMPRAVVVSFEFLNSYITCSPAFDNFEVADYNDERNRQILQLGETSGFFSSRHLLTRKVLSKLIPIQIYQVEFNNRPSLFSADDGVTNIVHDGDIFDHANIAKSLVCAYQNNKVKMAP